MLIRAHQHKKVMPSGIILNFYKVAGPLKTA